MRDDDGVWVDDVVVRRLGSRVSFRAMSPEAKRVFEAIFSKQVFSVDVWAENSARQFLAREGLSVEHRLERIAPAVVSASIRTARQPPAGGRRRLGKRLRRLIKSLQSIDQRTLERFERIAVRLVITFVAVSIAIDFALIHVKWPWWPWK